MRPAQMLGSYPRETPDLRGDIVDGLTPQRRPPFSTGKFGGEK